ncbi:MAG: AsmA-like C-terminal domain-containing protein [Alphaproteobacteria bacterium]|nr:AsmA-like C-terminal domain-containing protein [Alphaproteobacteria bacterium]
MKFLLWLSTSIVGLVLVGLSIIIFKVYQGPLSLNFIKPQINYLISDDKRTVEFKDAILNWNKQEARFSIQLLEVELRENNTKHIIAKIGDVGIKLKASALLKGKFVPSVISISNLHLHLFKEKDGSLTLLSNLQEGDPEESSIDFANLIPTHGGESILKPLKELRIKNSVIQITDRMTKEHWLIPKADLILTRHLQDISFYSHLDLKVANVNLHGQANLAKNPNGISSLRIKTQARLEKLNFDNLKILWPNYLAPLPREWLLTNLSEGYVPQAEANLSLIINFEGKQPELTVNAFYAKVDFENMSVNYFDALPPVKNVKGVAHFDKKHVVIKAPYGAVKNLKLKKADIIITGLDVKDQYIAMDLEVEGPITDALQILEAPSLKLTKNFAIQPKNVQGTATTALHFDFPLETTLTLDKVNLKASSKLNNLQINNLLATKELPLNLAKGNLSLTVDKTELITKGKAILNGAAIDLVWHEKFKTQKDGQSHYLVKADFDGESLKFMDIPNLFMGKAKLNLEYTKKSRNTSILKANVDFTSATPQQPSLQSLKPLGEKCEGQFLIEFENGRIRHVPSLKIWGPHLNIQLTAKVKKDGTELRMLEAPRLQVGNTNINVRLQKMKSGDYSAYINGSTLDIEPFVKNLTDEEKNFSNLGFNLSLNIARLRLGENRILHQCKGHGTFHQNKWKRFNLTGSIIGKKKESHLTVNQEYKNQQGNLLIKANNAGEALRLFGFSDSTKGGILLIKAAQFEKGPWIGKATIEKGFSISDAPAATRILAAASGFGFLDAVSGETISFEKFRTNFKLGKSQLILQDGRASGPSIGFTIAGLIDFKKDQLELYGTVLPYNLFNMFLAKIPLVGDLLGGKGGGIFGVSYRLTGSSSKPEVNVNPFSALTPGFLRKIFDPKEYEDFTEDTEDEDKATDDSKADNLKMNN